MKEWLAVVDQNGTYKENWEVYLHDGVFTVYTPARARTYKTLKNVEKFLSKYNLKIA